MLIPLFEWLRELGMLGASVMEYNIPRRHGIRIRACHNDAKNPVGYGRRLRHTPFIYTET